MHHGLLVAGLVIGEVSVLLQCLANPGHVAVTKDTEDTGEKRPFHPIPFAVLIFQKFDEYWDAPKPYLDELSYTFIADPVTAELAFRAGTAQAWDQMIPANLKSIANLSGYKVNTCPKTIMAALGDSVNPDSPFSKIQVRQALEYEF